MHSQLGTWRLKRLDTILKKITDAFKRLGAKGGPMIVCGNLNASHLSEPQQQDDKRKRCASSVQATVAKIISHC